MNVGLFRDVQRITEGAFVERLLREKGLAALCGSIGLILSWMLWPCGNSAKPG